MTGTGISTIVDMARWWTATRSATPIAGSFRPASHFRSAPAQKAAPLPVRMTERDEDAAVCKCSTRLRSIGGTRALRWAGRWRRTTTIPSRDSVSIIAHDHNWLEFRLGGVHELRRVTGSPAKAGLTPQRRAAGEPAGEPAG